MKKSLVVLIISWFSFTTSFGQQAELDAIVGNIQSNISEVKGSKETYKQEITSPKSCVLRYAYDEVDSKGETTSYAFEFNLADIDPYAVRQETQGDLIMVAMSVVNEQKLVKTFEDGETESYDDEVLIITTGIDNARALVDLIKKAIPLAKQITENKLKISSYEDMTGWLLQHVREVRLGDETYKQQIRKGDYPGSLVFTKTTVDAKSSTEEEFTFNLADINPNSINFEISGNKFGVNFETLRKQDVIQYKENKEEEPFREEITIVTSDVEAARDIKTVLSLAIPAAVKVVANAMPTINNESDALATAAKQVGTVTYGDNVITQTMTPNCITTITQIDQDPKETVKYEYVFNLMDLNANVLDFDVSREKMYLDLIIKDEVDLIKVNEDSKFKEYEDAFELYTRDVEVARRLRHALKKAVEYCAANYKAPYPGNTEGIIKWIMSNIGEVSIDGTTYKQQLEFVDAADINKVKFTKNEIDSKKAVEEVFEFNFSDINPLSINYDISGNDLLVTFKTNYESKIIKYYKDGEIQNYASGVEFVLSDIEVARNIISGMKKVVNDLSKE